MTSIQIPIVLAIKGIISERILKKAKNEIILIYDLKLRHQEGKVGNKGPKIVKDCKRMTVRIILKCSLLLAGQHLSVLS